MRTKDVRSALSIFSAAGAKVLHLAYDGPTLVMTRVDQENEVSATLNTYDTDDVREMFVATVKAHDLATGLKGQGRNITMRYSSDGNGLVVRLSSGKRTTNVSCAKDQPYSAPTVSGTSRDVDRYQLHRAITFTSIAASTDETRYNLCGVYLDAEENMLVAADGHRLHAMACRPTTAGSFASSMILRASTVSTILATLDATTGADVRVVQDSTHIEISVGAYRILATPIVSQFPPWRQIVPREGAEAFTITMDGKTLRPILTSIAKVVSRGLKLTINSHVTATSDLADGFTLSGAIKCVRNGHKGPDYTIGINPSYLAESLLDNDRSEIRFPKDNLSPIRVDHDHGGIAIIMPMRI